MSSEPTGIDEVYARVTSGLDLRRITQEAYPYESKGNTVNVRIPQKFMSTLDQYRQAKGSITQLEAAAKKELTVKFHALTAEMFAVQKELREEFGVRLAIPKKPPAKARQPRTKVATVVAAATVVESSPKIRALERKIETQQKKLAAALDPSASKRAKDRIYELDDELRLEREKA